MKLSVIVPALDEAEGIAGMLALLAPLRSDRLEVILVDGGSADATRALALPLADRVLEAPRGRARQMNAGAAVATGEAFLFLHADTRLPAGFDAAVRAALARAEWGRFDVSIEGRHPVLGLIARLMNLRSRLSGIATGDQAIFVRRAAFAALGGFPDQPLMEDIEFSRRMKRRGAPACLAAQVRTSGRRWESGGVWRTILLMWRLRLAYFLGVAPETLAARYRRR